MEKLKSKNIIIITIIILGIGILAGTIYKVTKIHQNRLVNCMIDKVEINALKCYREDNCKETITLQELYDLKYIDEVVNPITKEIYPSNTTITIENNKAHFNI